MNLIENCLLLMETNSCVKYKENEVMIVNVHRIKSDSFDYFDDVEESLIDRKLVRKFSS